MVKFSKSFEGQGTYARLAKPGRELLRVLAPRLPGQEAMGSDCTQNQHAGVPREGDRLDWQAQRVLLVDEARARVSE